MDNKTCALAKQQSILENEIEQLRSVVSRNNSLSESISNMIKSSTPCCTEVCSPNEQVPTIANSLTDIRHVAQETRDNLEDVARCFEEQLGGLKLEY